MELLGRPTHSLKSFARRLYAKVMVSLSTATTTTTTKTRQQKLLCKDLGSWIIWLLRVCSMASTTREESALPARGRRMIRKEGYLFTSIKRLKGRGHDGTRQEKAMMGFPSSNSPPGSVQHAGMHPQLKTEKLQTRSPPPPRSQNSGAGVTV